MGKIVMRVNQGIGNEASGWAHTVYEWGPGFDPQQHPIWMLLRKQI